jgi:hypothetical protein
MADDRDLPEGEIQSLFVLMTALGQNGNGLEKMKNKTFAERRANEWQYSVDREHSRTGN